MGKEIKKGGGEEKIKLYGTIYTPWNFYNNLTDKLEIIDGLQNNAIVDAKNQRKVEIWSKLDDIISLSVGFHV